MRNEKLMAGPDKKKSGNNFDESDLSRIFPDESHSVPVPENGKKHLKDDTELEERDYRPVRTRRSGRLGLLGGVMYAAFVIALSIILACAGWIAASDVLALNKEEISAVVTLPSEIFSEEQRDTVDDAGVVIDSETVRVADMDYVAAQLKDAGLIEYKSLFKLYAGFSHADTKIAPGTYKLSTRLDYRALVSNMHVGTSSMAVTTLTFPEGYTMAQIFDALEEAEVCSADSLYKTAAEYEYNFAFLDGIEMGDPKRLEGFIFPNTYDFYQGEQASSVINKFLEALHYRITAEMWQQCNNLGLTFRQAVTVASMIEKEAANDDERSAIASVIYNRMRANMTLGIDSTILYEFPDYKGGVNLPDDIRNFDSPYNTRLYKGLPPTPICNPGIASIAAALRPDSTGYYYYALDTETGAHRFFTYQSEFEAFIATQNYG